MSNGQNTGTWPEQEIIDAWLAKHDIDVPHQVSLELKEAVTQPRLEADERAASVVEALYEAGDVLEHWAKWWNGPGREHFDFFVLPPISRTTPALEMRDAALAAAPEKAGNNDKTLLLKRP